MLAKRQAVLILKSKMSVIPKVVWEHEVSVLNFKYGAHRIEKTKFIRLVQLDPKQSMVERGFQRFPIEEVDHDEEYNRLANTYGRQEPNDGGRMYVELAYGLIHEEQMKVSNEAKYRPMIKLGHSWIERPVIPEEQYNDGLTVFENAEEFKGKAPEVFEEGPTPNPQEPKKTYSAPLTDTETMFKIENMTKDGIKALLDDREVVFSPDDSKEKLHAQFMESLNEVVGVDPEE